MFLKSFPLNFNLSAAPIASIAGFKNAVISCYCSYLCFCFYIVFRFIPTSKKKQTKTVSKTKKQKKNAQIRECNIVFYKSHKNVSISFSKRNKKQTNFSKKQRIQKKKKR